MNRYRRLLLVSAAVFALGAVVTTGAFTGGDQAVRGVYLSPAETPNGDEYASIDANGELEVSMTNLNPEATSIADDVFVIGTDLQQAEVWIEDNQSAVTFYRMDTRESIEASGDSVQLTDDESITVGVRIASGTDEVILETITVRAEIPSISTPTDTDTPTDSGGSTDPPSNPNPPSDPDTPNDTDTSTESSEPTETPSGTNTPRESGGSSGEDTPADDDDTPTATDDGASGTDTVTETATPAVTESPTPTPTGSPTTTTTPTEAGGGANPTDTPGVNVEIVELTASPENPAVGETVTLSGTFENVGEREGPVTVELRAGGEVVATETVTLAPGERHTLTGTVTFDEPGSYEVALADSSITVTVTERGQSPLEVGGFAPLLLALLAAVAVALLALAYLRSDDPELVVRAGDDSWSKVELVADAESGVTETDDDGRTVLRFELASSGVTTFDPAFTVRNTVSDAIGVRVTAVDEDGEPVESGVTIESVDGTDLAAFPEGGDAANVIDGGETLTVRMTIDRDDAAIEQIESLRVETSSEGL